MQNKSINVREREQSLGIYVHIPFCKSRCIYCDFISSIDRAEERKKYVEYLIKQIEFFGKKYKDGFVVDTLYFGGGTPSLLDKEQLKAVTQKIYLSFCCNVKEFTVEANPCSVDEEKLTALKECGVSRLSIGVQSFDDNLLKMLGRRHSSRQAEAAVALAKSYGFDVSVDAMIGLPGQSARDISAFVDVADGLGAEHISVYMLSIEDGTVLQKLVEAGKLAAKSDDEVAELYEYACKCLQNKGFERYEISNFCKGGKVSLHNLRYWRRLDYLGVGMGAHSLIKDERWRNADNFDEYYSSVDEGRHCFDLEKLSLDEQEKEFIMLNFRLSEGINLSRYFDLFGCDFLKKYENAIKKNATYLDISKDSISIKNIYLQLMNGIIVDFI